MCAVYIRYFEQGDSGVCRVRCAHTVLVSPTLDWLVAMAAQCMCLMRKVGQNHMYIQCMHGIFGREITKYTVIYSAYIRSWPTLLTREKRKRKATLAVETLPTWIREKEAAMTLKAPYGFRADKKGTKYPMNISSQTERVQYVQHH